MFPYKININTSDSFNNSSEWFNLDSDYKNIFKDKIITMECDGYYHAIKFSSDSKHYLIDYAESEDENRISIFKDSKGYIVFKVYSKKDKYNRAHTYQISKNISDWVAGEQHHIAISPKLGSKDHRDELHLFIDGLEVPNNLRFGSAPNVKSGDVFRTVVPEIVVGTVTKNVVAENDLTVNYYSDIVYSAKADFGLANIVVGDLICIEEPGFAEYYTIITIVDFNRLQLDTIMPLTMTNARYTINKFTAPVSTELLYESNLLVSRFDGTTEEELPGLRATVPAYGIIVDGYGQSSIVIKDKAQAGDQIYIKTLGLNHRRFRDKLYIWSNIESIIKTNFPPPINLDYAKIYPLIKLRYLTNTAIPSLGSTSGTLSIIGNLISVSGIIPDTQSSDNIGGRTLSITFGGSNIDFSYDGYVMVHGDTYSGTDFEFITFSSASTKQTTEQFKTITSIDIGVNCITPLFPSAYFEIKEYYQNTKLENSGGIAPIYRYAYQEASNFTFSGDGYTLTCEALNFYYSQIGKTLVLTSPALVAGSYIITSIIDSHNLTVSRNFPITFIDGAGAIYNMSISRSGFANGLFAFEQAGNSPTPYYLKQGYYEFDYATYLEIPFELKSENLFIGSDYLGQYPANAIIDEVRALSVASTDTRIGEELASGERSITTDCAYVKEFIADENTTLLLHMNELPAVDSSIPYSRYSNTYLQSATSLNSNFNSSLYINTNPLIIDNDRILYNTAGTIEFWFNPDLDTRNDPTTRYLFDANASITEKITSLTKTTIVLPTRAKQIYSVQLQTEKSVTGMNYSLGGTLANDGLTFTLGHSLPYQQTPITVVYVPYGLNGDRLSIYKDDGSICRFVIVVNGAQYELSSPIFWTRNTWHRLMATWDFTVPRHGEMHFYIDGEEKVFLTSGTLIAGLGFSVGNIGPNNNTQLNISIKDQFQQLFVGSNFLGGNVYSGKYDNLKISRIKKSPVSIGGQPVDNDYSSNISAVLPVVEDLYTTYLLNFEKEATKIDDFSILKNKITGIYDFELDVLDTFKLIQDNPRVKNILEKLIDTLKPANSRAFIKYII